ncbi:MAG TPA: DUF4215 domain-containing protein, partial [Polyangium sp.]|nr:DUF4215 domain-containing protein [Polyangium sp.]
MIKRGFFAVMWFGALLGGTSSAHAVPITQNTDPQTTGLGISTACGDGLSTSQSSYYRAFDLYGLGIPASAIRSVQFGVDALFNGPLVVRVRLYTLASTLEVANLVPIGEPAFVTLPSQLGTLVTVPLTPNVSFDTQDSIVVEIFVPNGQATGASFYIGSNAAGQSAPGYVRAPDCVGMEEITDLAALGNPNMHIVMTLDVGACGDGTVEIAAGEVCDDGNTASGDGCDANCKPTGCGNGVVTNGEVCDDGNTVSGDGCDANCKPTGCGNGVVSSGEVCDDGNTVSGDGCDANCTVTGCGNGIVTLGEECDDGNDVDGDGCDLACKSTACGNGTRTEGEACDDGNDVDGDGCDTNCT